MEKRYGLLGKNISYSLSPVMHNSAFRHFNIPATYDIFDMGEADAETFLREEVAAGKVRGLNVTVPYKIKVKQFLEGMVIDDALDGKERRTTITSGDRWTSAIGAVNTLRSEDGGIWFYNTDVLGFAHSLRFDDTKYNLYLERDKKVFIAGAGGAGRAIAIYLTIMGLAGAIEVYDLDAEKLDSLMAAPYVRESGVLSAVRDIDEAAEKIRDCSLVVNATPVGTREGDGSPVPLESLSEGMTVYDLVYARETELVKHARAKGLRVSNGLGMLVNQAALAFGIWTSQPQDITRQVMRDAALTEMEHRKGGG